MITWQSNNLDATLRKLSPVKVFRKIQAGILFRPEQCDPACVRLDYVEGRCGQVDVSYLAHRLRKADTALRCQPYKSQPQKPAFQPSGKICHQLWTGEFLCVQPNQVQPVPPATEACLCCRPDQLQMARLPGIQHAEKSHLLTARGQLPCHLIGYQASEGKSQEGIGTRRLHPAQFLDIETRHCFKPDQGGRFAI